MHIKKKDMCLKEIGWESQNMLTILGSIVKVIGRGGVVPLNEQEKLHFDNE